MADSTTAASEDSSYAVGAMTVRGLASMGMANVVVFFLSLLFKGMACGEE